ncbi:hypothetical protein [Microbacterium sp. cf332]|uniref:hypothetical protein n=1 Tax=Microbacterium sp. cf332 TaxID=1761804 RepID=UPI00115F9A0F|nr:hypothetical protein [Microbacterium sp. cf332]
MSELSVTVHGVVQTTRGLALLSELEEGHLSVGDVVGVYVPGARVPSFDVQIKEMHLPSKGQVRELANRNREKRDYLFTLYVENSGHPVLAGAWIAANTSDVAGRFGVTLEDLML